MYVNINYNVINSKFIIRNNRNWEEFFEQHGVQILITVTVDTAMIFTPINAYKLHTHELFLFASDSLPLRLHSDLLIRLIDLAPESNENPQFLVKPSDQPEGKQKERKITGGRETKAVDEE